MPNLDPVVCTIKNIYYVYMSLVFILRTNQYINVLFLFSNISIINGGVGDKTPGKSIIKNLPCERFQVRRWKNMKMEEENNNLGL